MGREQWKILKRKRKREEGTIVKGGSNKRIVIGKRRGKGKVSKGIKEHRPDSIDVFGRV